MNSKFYKCCAVPQCKNTTVKTPEKLFIHVPRTKTMRRKWLQLARRDPALVSTQSKMYFCEDHFDVSLILFVTFPCIKIMFLLKFSNIKTGILRLEIK